MKFTHSITRRPLKEGSGVVAPTYLVKYQYDAEGRLAKVLGPKRHVALRGDQEPTGTEVVVMTPTF